MWYGIGLFARKECNIGCLCRSAYNLGASFTFQIGRANQRGNTVKSDRHIPHFVWSEADLLKQKVPLISVELGGHPISNFVHPQQCIYILGHETGGIPNYILDQTYKITIPSKYCLNVSVAGSIVLYDRIIKNDIHSAPHTLLSGQSVRFLRQTTGNKKVLS